MSHSRTKFTYVVLPLVPIFVSIAFAWNWVLIADDALISHRYVENFLERGEPYFNSNDRVLGLTSPGYFLVLSGLSKIVPLTIAYKFIAAVAYTVAGLALVNLFPASKISHRLLASTVFASNLHLAYWFFSGLETFFIPLFVMASVWAIRKRAVSLLIASFGLSILFRPEAWIAIFPVAVVSINLVRTSFWSDRWKSSAKYILASISLVVLAYISISAFIVAHYDNFVPMSLAAKAIGRSTFGVVAIKEFSAASIATLNLPIPYGYLVGVIIIALAAGIVMWKPPRTAIKHIEWAIGTGTIFFGIYLLTTGAWAWGWHYVFVSYATSFFLMAASITVAKRFRKQAAVPILALLVLAVWSGAEYGNLKNERINSFYIDQMQAAGAFVNDRYSEGKIVIVGSTGYFGRATRNMQVHDSIGLFTPEYVDARQDDISVLMVDVIPWDVFVCHKPTPPTDPISECIGDDNSGRVVGNFGVLWVIENTE